jgi:anti-sigma regulatory factor (Ser/Thr protein kinase)
VTGPLRNPVLLAVADPSQVGEARRVGVALAERLGFAETRRGELAIVLTEAANNLLRHAGGGELIVRPIDRDSAVGLEVLSIDRGPGMPNVGHAMRDGFSTGGTSGTGLGAIRRLSSEFDVFSVTRGQAAAAAARSAPLPGTGLPPATGAAASGTVLVARLWTTPEPPPPPGDVEPGVVCLPVANEEACGDAWRTLAGADGRWTALVADGLGHGPSAAAASQQAVRLFEEQARRSAAPAAVVAAMHAGLRSTRGAAVSVAEVNPARRLLRFCGVGNVAGVVFGPPGTHPRRMVSHNGTAGAAAHRVQEFSYPVAPGDLVILHSDGISSSWDLANYPGLRDRHPAVVAGVLYRDHRRTRDDATVLVARIGPPTGEPSKAPLPAGGSPA